MLRCPLLLFLLLSLPAFASPATHPTSLPASRPTQASTPAPKGPYLRTFEAMWQTSLDVLSFPQKEQFFSPARKEALAKQIALVESHEAFVALLKPFFHHLPVSHTGLFTRDDVYFHVLTARPVWHVGVEWHLERGHVALTALLDGYPAEKAGLRVGDRIVSPPDFHPFRSFRQGQPLRVRVERSGRSFDTEIAPVFENYRDSLWKASQASLRTFVCGGRRLAYFKLWATFAPPGEVQRVLTHALDGVEGWILDLRGGFGGMYLGYQSLFVNKADLAPLHLSFQASPTPPTRPSHAVTPQPSSLRAFQQKARLPKPPLDAQSRRIGGVFVARDRAAKIPPSRVSRVIDRRFPLFPHRPWLSRPKVVWIDRTTRSAKEILAYQLRRQKRTHVLGQTTFGALNLMRIRRFGESLLVLGRGEIRFGKQKHILDRVGVPPHHRASLPSAAFHPALFRPFYAPFLCATTEGPTTEGPTTRPRNSIPTLRFFRVLERRTATPPERSQLSPELAKNMPLYLRKIQSVFSLCEERHPDSRFREFFLIHFSFKINAQGKVEDPSVQTKIPPEKSKPYALCLQTELLKTQFPPSKEEPRFRLSLR